jgi:hypothetical protein
MKLPQAHACPARTKAVAGVILFSSVWEEQEIRAASSSDAFRSVLKHQRLNPALTLGVNSKPESQYSPNGEYWGCTGSK